MHPASARISCRCASAATEVRPRRASSLLNVIGFAIRSQGGRGKTRKMRSVRNVLQSNILTSFGYLGAFSASIGLSRVIDAMVEGDDHGMAVHRRQGVLRGGLRRVLVRPAPDFSGILVLEVGRRRSSEAGLSPLQPRSARHPLNIVSRCPLLASTTTSSSQCGSCTSTRTGSIARTTGQRY